MKKILLLITLFFVIIGIVLLVTLKQTNKEQPKEVVEKKVTDVIELKFAHHLPQNTVLHKAALRYANEIKTKTNGQVKISVFPNQELGNSYELIELSRAGQIDIIATPTAKMGLHLPSMHYVDLPFLFPTKQDAHALFDGKVGHMLLKDLNKIELLGVAFWEGGFKNFTANRPLQSIDDFNNLKIRVMKSPIISEQILALKAKPISIDLHTTKKALMDTVVDAQETALTGTVSMELYKMHSDFTFSEHAYIAHIISLSQKSISKLPLNIQTLLIQTAQEITPWQREALLLEEKKMLELLEQSNINIHTLSLSEKEKFIDATSYIMKKYESSIGSHIISLTQEYLHTKYNTKSFWAIGIDADLSMGAKGSGLAIKRGVELAVEKINEEGGLLGKEVVVIAKDHQGIAQQGKENINEFIKNKNIIGVIGGKHSAVIASYMKDIQDNGLIFFSPWAAAASVTQNGYEENYVFRVSLNDKLAAQFLAQKALAKGVKPIVVVENSIWGKGALENINLFFESNGVQRQEGIIVNRGEEAFDTIFHTINKGKYDVIIMVLNSQEASKFVKYKGVNNFTLPIISHWGMVGDSFFEDNKNHLKDIDLQFIQTFTFTNNDKKEAKDLAQQYMSNYLVPSKKQINAVTGVAQAYDSTMLLAQAIRQCNTVEFSKVKQCLENIHTHDGVLKKYQKPFDTTNHDALTMDDFFMAEFDDNGGIVPQKE